MTSTVVFFFFPPFEQTRNASKVLWQALLSQLGRVKSLPKCRARPGRKWEHEPYEVVILVYFEPRTTWMLYDGGYIIARSRVYGAWSVYSGRSWVSGSREDQLKLMLIRDSSHSWLIKDCWCCIWLQGVKAHINNQPMNAATNTIHPHKLTRDISVTA